MSIKSLSLAAALLAGSIGFANHGAAQVPSPPTAPKPATPPTVVPNTQKPGAPATLPAMPPAAQQPGTPGALPSTQPSPQPVPGTTTVPSTGVSPVNPALNLLTKNATPSTPIFAGYITNPPPGTYYTPYMPAGFYPHLFTGPYFYNGMGGWTSPYGTYNGPGDQRVFQTYPMMYGPTVNGNYWR